MEIFKQSLIGYLISANLKAASSLVANYSLINKINNRVICSLLNWKSSQLSRTRSSLNISALLVPYNIKFQGYSSQFSTWLKVALSMERTARLNSPRKIFLILGGSIIPIYTILQFALNMSAESR